VLKAQSPGLRPPNSKGRFNNLIETLRPAKQELSEHGNTTNLDAQVGREAVGREVVEGTRVGGVSEIVGSALCLSSLATEHAELPCSYKHS
jgi:hypothetical protein